MTDPENSAFLASRESRPIPRKFFHIGLGDAYRLANLPKALQQNIEAVRDLNPGWKYKYYEEDDVEAYLAKYPDLLATYKRINPVYGAARCDFFRYVLMYHEGGVYTDIKAGLERPLDEVIRDDDQYILSHWAVRFESDAEPGIPKEGEYQQWHIISAPRHPFLRACLWRVQQNINEYQNVGADSSGLLAVLRTTGPIAFTRAVRPLRPASPHRLVESEKELGLRYIFNIPNFDRIPDDEELREMRNRYFPGHYAYQSEPLIR
tara:strand:+ start:26755 stop:27543 length:789 start_codon:yes stop_codon:yes gene_type:complete